MGEKNNIIKLIGLGAGGHVKVLIDILQHDGKYSIEGLLDSNKDLCGRKIMGLPVLGDESLLPAMGRRWITHFFVAIAGVGDNKPRKRLFELALYHGLKPIRIVHPSACISDFSAINVGTTVMANAVVNAGTEIGKNAIINTGSIIEHDCVICDHVHVATGARLASSCRVEAGAHIGVGATVLQSTTIGENAIIGAGAVVIDDVPPETVVIGIPARPLNQ